MTRGCAPRRGPSPALDQTHRAYLRAVDEAVARLRAVETDLRALLTLEPLRARVERLRCFRGIDDLTALTIAAEFGDPAALPDGAEHDGVCRPRPLRALERRRNGPGGRSPKRAMPICAACSSKRRGTIAIIPSSAAPCAPAARRATATSWRGRGPRSNGSIGAIARLAARGKPKQHVVTAVARELTGFVWAVLTQ